MINHQCIMKKDNTELMLIRVTGEDRRGLIASITASLAKYDITILDIGLDDIHNTLSFGILIRISVGRVMKDLLYKTTSMGNILRFYPISKEDYAQWVGMQGKNRYILTLLGRKLTARQISATTHILAQQGLNIDGIRRLTGRIPLEEEKANIRACIEFSVRGTPKDSDLMQAQLFKIAREQEVDYSFQQDNMYRRMRRLICFDMDSTLIQTEVIDWPCGPVWAIR